MSTQCSLIKNLRMLSAGLVLCSVLPAYGANIGVCRQPTPHPYAADGVCRPSSGPWGTSRTQWRPWPGDVIAKPKTTGEETPGDADSLKGFQPPSPRDEDLRGPAKSKKAKGSEDSNDDVPGIDAFDNDAPAGDETLPAIPGFETQGQLFFDPGDDLGNGSNDGPTLSLQLPIAQNVVRSITQDDIAQHITMLSGEELPGEEEPEAALRPILPRSQEFLGADPFVTISDQLPELDSEPMPESRDQDLPPALPSSLRRMQAPLLPATSTSDLLGTATPSAQPQPMVHEAMSHANAPVQNRAERAAWNQPSGVIRLINPAAASVTPAGDNALKQAVYYEATDQPVIIHPNTPSR